MERARATWTDERLDDLARRVDDGFNRVDEDLRSLRLELSGRIDAQGRELGARIDGLDARIATQGADLGARIDAQTQRIDVLQRTMVQFGGAMTIAILATLVSVLATRA